MTVNKIKIPRKYDDLTVPSDNTRVASPYRIRSREESDPDITRADRAE
jgi:hypothetical protein